MNNQNENPTESAKQMCVAIRIDPANEKIFPAGNHAGRLLVSDVISEALKASSNNVFGVGSSGPLNNSFYRFLVLDVASALSVVTAALKRTSILGFAVIARLDEDEQIWRTIYPEGHRDLDSLDVKEFYSREADEETRRRWLADCEARFGPLNPPPPPEGESQ